MITTRDANKFINNIHIKRKVYKMQSLRTECNIRKSYSQSFRHWKTFPRCQRRFSNRNRQQNYLIYVYSYWVINSPTRDVWKFNDFFTVGVIGVENFYWIILYILYTYNTNYDSLKSKTKPVLIQTTFKIYI